MQIKSNVFFKDYTTLKIGGPIQELIEVENKDKLAEAVKYAKDKSLPFLVIGGGSNLLISDEGFDGLVIKNNIKGISKEGDILTTQAGTNLQDLVNFAIENSLGGLNKLTGIPGTLGGAIYGNAGAYGQSISDNLIEVLVFDGEKEIKFSKDECKFEYRDSIFKKNHFIVLEAKFKLFGVNKDQLKKEAAETIQKRLIKYPPGILCPGSFFKNLVVKNIPEEILKNIPKNLIMYGKIPAGALLDAVGAKGDSLRQIKIADNHGNTFINLGDGSAKDFYTLAKKYALKVKEKFGIELEPEVQLINLPPLT